MLKKIDAILFQASIRPIKAEQVQKEVIEQVFVPQEVTNTEDDYIPGQPNHEHIIKIAVSAIAKAEFITTEEAREFLFEAVKAEIKHELQS